MWDAITGLVSNLVPGDSLQLFAGIAVALFNYRMWRSIGWLFLGLALAVIGFTVWNRGTIGAAAKTAATAAVL